MRKRTQFKSDFFLPVEVDSDEKLSDFLVLMELVKKI